MSAPNRTTTGLVAVMACAAALGVAVQQPARQSRMAVSELLSEPDEASRLVQRRMRAKAEVVDRLLEGELSLLEAAAWFRHYNDAPPQHRADFRGQWPGDSDGEKLCRQVISWVRGQLQGRTPESEIEEVVLGYEDELAGLRAAGGAVELPW